MFSAEVQQKILEFQRVELTEFHIYERMAAMIADPKNKAILKRLAEDEKRHYEIFKRYSGKDVPLNWLKIATIVFLSRIFGVTFGIKLSEKGEGDARDAYSALENEIPEAKALAHEEAVHEEELVAMVDEDSLNYVGSMVLGLSDALVELTGVLAGLTFALGNARLIAVVGLITGVAASLAMAASEYLSTKAEGEDRSPLKAAAYTGVAYIFTVLFLVAPYLLATNLILCLTWTMINAVIVILVFTFYAAVTQGVSFRKRFAEMTLICFSVAALSFLFGVLIKRWLGVDV